MPPHGVTLWEILGSNPWSWLTRFSKQTFVLPYNSVVATPKLLSLVEIISWCKGEQVYIPLNKILRGNYFSKNVKIGCPCLSSNYNRIMAPSTTLSQKYSEFPHKNRTCHSWNRCIERVSWTYVYTWTKARHIILLYITVTGSFFLQRFRLFLAHNLGKLSFS